MEFIDDVIPRAGYAHKTNEKVLRALQCSKEQNFDIEEVYAYKQQFRLWLKFVIDNKAKIKGYDDELYKTRVIDAFEKSDFDWTDREKLKSFAKQYLGLDF